METTTWKIYTRKGDKGQTRLLGGEKVAKDDARVKTYGAVDEFQAHLGLARALTGVNSFQSILHTIQEDLFVAGAELASIPEALPRLQKRIDSENTQQLESWIDQFAMRFDPPRHFVVPGKSPDSAALHVARAVCRRCERLIVMLNRPTGVYDELLVYFNRLSDLLFVLAWSSEVIAIIEEVVREVIAADVYGGKRA
jgi:cob(I)alamin adenosyltransferase